MSVMASQSACLCVQQLVEAINKENTKVPQYCHFVCGPVMQEAFERHDVIMDQAVLIMSS